MGTFHLDAILRSNMVETRSCMVVQSYTWSCNPTFQHGRNKEPRARVYSIVSNKFALTHRLFGRKSTFSINNLLSVVTSSKKQLQWSCTYTIKKKESVMSHNKSHMTNFCTA